MLTVTKKQRQAGFTIVELLIVIIVIAILATLVIMAYNGVQQRAYDTVVKDDLSNFSKKLEIARLDNNDAYPTALTASMGFSFSKSSYALDPQSTTLRYCVNTSTNNYIMYALSKSGSYFKYTATGGLQSATASYGYGICSQIGLVTTNPVANGLSGTTWASWAN